MSDVHQGSTESTPPPVDVTTRNIPEPITGSTSEIAEKSVKALNEQRARTGEAVEIGEGHDRNPVRMRYREPGQKTLRQASKDVSDYHRLQKDDAQFLLKQGMTPNETLDLAKNEEGMRSLGYTPEQARQWAAGQEPPVPIGLVDEREGLKAPLRDFETARDDLDEPLSVREATRQQTNFRQALAQQQEALRARNRGRRAARRSSA
jgi:hypothetical protein